MVSPLTRSGLSPGDDGVAWLALMAGNDLSAWLWQVTHLVWREMLACRDVYPDV